LRYKPVTAIT